MTSSPKGRLLSFEDWIRETGIETIARALRVDPATVRHWEKFRADPSVKHLRKLKRISRGRMTYELMIDRPTPTNRQIPTDRQSPKNARGEL